MAMTAKKPESLAIWSEIEALARFLSDELADPFYGKLIPQNSSC
jgi:hypothetical protein